MKRLFFRQITHCCLFFFCLIVSVLPAFADGFDPDAAQQGNLPVTVSPHWIFSASNIPAWQTLLPGLEIAFFPARDGYGHHIEMIIVRIHPENFIFSVHTASVEGESLSLDAWAERHNLAAAINAGMYLPDKITNTGYLRVGTHLNNGHIASKFGAFFVCKPKKADLPEAALLDRFRDDWESALPDYNDVVQNYRLIGADRHLLWNSGGARHAIAAIATDGEQHILFIHCREPLTGMDFGSLLLTLPMDIRLVMYVEGGSQAGLLVRTPALHQTWMGRHPADILVQGNARVVLPNIIGIIPKEQWQKRR